MSNETVKDNYDICFDRMFGQFKTMDFNEVAKAGGNIYDAKQNKILFKFFGSDYTFNCETGEICPYVGRDSLLIIAHFMRYKMYINTQLTGNLVSLKEVPGGGVLFYKAFKEMAIDPLVDKFGNNAEGIYKAAETLCGKKADYGHASITVNAFPKVPITLVVWEGDDELLSSATILYDKSVSDFMHIEDVISAGIVASEKAIKAV